MARRSGIAVAGFGDDRFKFACSVQHLGSPPCQDFKLTVYWLRSRRGTISPPPEYWTRGAALALAIASEALGLSRITFAPELLFASMLKKATLSICQLKLLSLLRFVSQVRSARAPVYKEAAVSWRDCFCEFSTDWGPSAGAEGRPRLRH